MFGRSPSSWLLVESFRPGFTNDFWVAVARVLLPLEERDPEICDPIFVKTGLIRGRILGRQAQMTATSFSRAESKVM